MHVPVLARRVLDLLGPALDSPGAVAVDATVGLGGHSEALLAAFAGLRVIGIDRDPEAVDLATRQLARHGDRITVVCARYDRLPEVLAELGLRRVHGVLFDLGVSSMQLDRPERGFTYARDAPLDMRMDRSGGPTAADVVNTYSVDELARVLRSHGEERFARRIARAVVAERAHEPFSGSSRLAELVRTAVPAATRRTGGHPAKRTFQALRIEVNAELASLQRALPAALEVLTVGGRVAVLSYHSLEDRLVKRTFAAGAAVRAPVDLPVVPPGDEPWLRLLTRGSVAPDAEEVAANPRAASARLRAAEKLREAGQAA